MTVTGLAKVGEVTVTEVTLSVNLACALQLVCGPRAVARKLMPMSFDWIWKASKANRPEASAVIAIVKSGSPLDSWIRIEISSFGCQPSPIILTT